MSIGSGLSCSPQQERVNLHSVMVRNVVLAVFDQPLREWFNGNARGIFSRRSHLNGGGKPKVEHPTRRAAESAAASLQRHPTNSGVEFAAYKCLFCDGFHVGRNR